MYYFSHKMKQEALENAHKQIQIAQAIYDNTVKTIEHTAEYLSTDTTLQQLLEQRTQEKIERYLTAHVNDKKNIHQYLIFDKNAKVISKVITQRAAHLKLTSSWKYNPILNRALHQHKTTSSIELIESPNANIIAVT
ncbi:MAG: cache domain-containing protein, partial [Pseudomonadota bacterium]|nr:cache domain-containing protein [Pseudomonadota bacterium]